MKKVVILSCSTGQGHNSCAQALMEYFEGQGVRCEIRDSLDFISPWFSRFISWGHSFIYRYLPNLFRWGYRYSEGHPTMFREKSMVYKMLMVGENRLYQFITVGGFDAAICTHVFSAIMLTHMCKRHPKSIETAFVATDYTCYPGVNATQLHHYFIPHEQLAGAFEACGIPKDRLTATGIPVARSFFVKTDRMEAKRQLRISLESRHLVMMCGSMGCGPMLKLLKQIIPRIPEDDEVSVLCGTNKYLHARLSRQYRAHANIHVIGYTNQVPLYLDSADLYITKPGGISITEAAAKKLPMVFVNAVAGCEQHNMDFFANIGAATTAETIDHLASESASILCSIPARQAMERVLWQYRQQDGAKNIYEAMNRGACICTN